MAERRCIAKKIYTQRKFLELPVTARDLYTYLVLFSDIDGVVEAYSVMRMINASITDLKILDDCNYVKVLNEEWVTYISEFTSFNILDGRGMKGSEYRPLLLEVLPDVKLTQLRDKTKKKNQKKESHVNHMGITCSTQHNPTQPNLTQHNYNNYDFDTLEQEILSNN